MKIEITAGGIYGANGEIEVGTIIDVKEEPKGWAGRYRIVGGKTKSEAKAAVTNPENGGAKGYAVVDKGSGWHVITLDGQEVTKSMRKDDVTGFEELSDEDKLAFVDLHKIEV